jgi:hypothetical protein
MEDFGLRIKKDGGRDAPQRGGRWDIGYGRWGADAQWAQKMRLWRRRLE